MTRTMALRTAFWVLMLLLGCAGTVVAEEAWPTKPITIITSSSAGSGGDAVVRALARRLTTSLKQPVIIENRPGASGVIAVNSLIKARGDGYTFLFCTASTAVIWPAVGRSVPFDPLRDLVPIAQVAAGGVMLLVNSGLPARNLRDLVDLVNANPGKYGYGTWAVGSSGHLMMEWLKSKTGMKIDHVPYRDMVQLLTELSSGVLMVGWADPGAALPFLRTGKVRGIAINGTVRAPLAPDAATLVEQGYKFDTVGWLGMFAAAGTDPAVVKRFSEEIRRAQSTTEMAALMNGINLEPPPNKTQAEFRDIVANDLATWKRIAMDARIAVDGN